MVSNQLKLTLSPLNCFSNISFDRIFPDWVLIWNELYNLILITKAYSEICPGLFLSGLSGFYNWISMHFFILTANISEKKHICMYVFIYFFLYWRHLTWCNFLRPSVQQDVTSTETCTQKEIKLSPKIHVRNVYKYMYAEIPYFFFHLSRCW